MGKSKEGQGCTKTTNVKISIRQMKYLLLLKALVRETNREYSNDNEIMRSHIRKEVECYS